MDMSRRTLLKGTCALLGVQLFDVMSAPYLGRPAFAHSDVYEPQNYGEIGGADDRPAILAALAAARANKGVLYIPSIPSGAYSISSRIPLETGDRVIFSPSQPMMNLQTSGEWLFEIRGSDIYIENACSYAYHLTGAGAFLFRTDLAPIERVTISNVKLTGMTNIIRDMPSTSNRIILLKLMDITSYLTRGPGVFLQRSFAYQYAERINVLYNGVPNPMWSGWEQVGLEGGFFEDIDVTSGVVTPTNLGAAHGFKFTQCQALWIKSCMADMVGGGGLYAINGNYIYVDQFIASMVGTHGISLVNSHKVTLKGCNVGGRAGMPYAPSMPGIYAEGCADLVADDSNRVYDVTGSPVMFVNCPRGRNNVYTQ